MSNDARNVAIHVARPLSGGTPPAIEDAFGPEHYSGVSGVVSRMKPRLANDRSMKRKVEVIERRLL